MTTKEKVIGGIAVLAVILALVGLVGGNQSVSDEQIQSIVSQLSAVSYEKLGSGVTRYPNSGIEMIYAKIGDRYTEWQGGAMSAGDDEDSWQNLTNDTVYAKYGAVTTSGTASSSYRIFMVATSAASIPTTHDFTAIPLSNNNLISGQVWATSTPATTTNSITAAGNDTVVIPDKWYLITYYQAVDLAACGATICEPATSTNNGWGIVTWSKNCRPASGKVY